MVFLAHNQCELNFKYIFIFQWETNWLCFHICYLAAFNHFLHLLIQCSVGASQEQSNTTDNKSGCGSICSHLERAQQLLSIKVKVEWSLNSGLWVGIWLRFGDPGNVADGELDDLRSLASNLIHLSLIKR